MFSLKFVIPDKVAIFFKDIRREFEQNSCEEREFSLPCLHAFLFLIGKKTNSFSGKKRDIKIRIDAKEEEGQINVLTLKGMFCCFLLPILRTTHRTKKSLV